MLKFEKKIRRQKVKIFVGLWFFLELFTTSNSGHGNKAKCQEGLFSFGFWNALLFLNITSYIRTYKSRAVFERTDRKISKKEKIGWPRFRRVKMLILILQKYCAQCNEWMLTNIPLHRPWFFLCIIYVFNWIFCGKSYCFVEMQFFFVKFTAYFNPYIYCNGQEV